MKKLNSLMKQSETIKKSGSTERIIKMLLNISENDIKSINAKNSFIEIAYETIGKEYEITDNNKEVISMMFNYFLGNEGELDLNKGILLSGNYGTGKSTLFYILRKFINQYWPMNENAFMITSTEEILADKSDINKSKLLFNIESTCPMPIHVLINEFGHDYDIKIYGSDADDIIESFLMKRYDIFQRYKKLTHITTNLSKNDILDKYKPVIVDRFKEMFNIIELNGKSFRK